MEDIDALLLILENACEYDNVSDVNERELKRLVRLGKWAEDQALPLLQHRAENECYIQCSCSFEAECALKELPK